MSYQMIAAHIAALNNAVKTVEIDDGDIDALVDNFVDDVLPANLVESNDMLVALADGMEYKARLLANQVLETYRENTLADLREYLQHALERANRAHADDPTSDNLYELEELQTLLRGLES